MHATIRKILSILSSFALFFVSLFSVGELPSSFEMPELITGEYGKWVNPFVGTGGVPYLAGNTFPGAVAPYGAVKLSPDSATVGDTKLITSWGTGGYTYSHAYISGFSHTRLSGTGAADMAHFRVTPTSGSRKAGGLFYSHSDEQATAGYYAVNLPELGCLAELTATPNVGAHRYTFRTDRDARIFIDVTSFMAGGSCSAGEVKVDEATGEISGMATVNTAFTSRYGGLTAYFVAVFNRDYESYTIFSGDNAVDGTSAQGDNVAIDINFGNCKNSPIEMKLGMSFVSVENASENLQAQTGGLDFDAVRQSTLDSWDSYLSRIDIKGSAEVKKNFYTALYHSMIMPSTYTDVNGQYAAFGGTVKTADGFTYMSDMSLWDTFRTVAPLQTLIAPEIQRNMLISLMNMAETFGRFPRWPSGTGETHSMFGSPANMVITESFLKGFDCIDYEKAYEYMTFEANSDSGGHDGRVYNNIYLQYGYCPADLTDNKCVSRTLEYCYADYCIYLLALELGKTDDAEEYLERSKNYLNLWDSEKQCFRPKNSDGSWTEPFSDDVISFVDDILGTKFAYGFCEGSSRNWQWSVQYDTAALISLYGGKESFTKSLTTFMSDANAMRNPLIPSAGYWHGNQHDIHAIYLFNDAGHPELTQKWARWAMQTRYASVPDGLDGNDDGGTISAWYVLSAIGLYPLAGTDRYSIGSPAVESAQVNLGNGKTLTVKAENQSDGNVYVQSVTLNGTKLTSPEITHDMIAGGGELIFIMGSSPAENGGY